MSLSGINSRLSNIESRLSAMGGASAPVADNSEEVAKLGEKLATVESKADAGLNACNQVMMANKKDAETFYPKVTSLIDRLAKKNQIHKNKAANLKSKLAKYVATL